MKLSIKTLDNKAAGEITLDASVFGLPVRKDILHRMVNWQLAKKQAGTHKTKERSEVSRTTAKVYKQKGTGRARHGSLSSPTMRGGGTAFGPRVRSHAHDLPKKIRKLALKTALSLKANEGKLLVISNLDLKEAKTALLSKNLKSLGVDSALIIDADNINDNFKKAASNIIKVDVLPAIGTNVYDILRRENLVLTEAAVKQLQERLA